jgi:hypothetical protein
MGNIWLRGQDLNQWPSRYEPQHVDSTVSFYFRRLADKPLKAQLFSQRLVGIQRMQTEPDMRKTAITG